MAAKSYYLDNAILNAVLCNTTYTSPAAVYVGLFTVTPTPSTPGTEVGEASYNRIAVTFGAPVNGVAANSAPVAFDTALTIWGHIVACGVFDDVTGGNLLYFGTLGTAKDVGVGDQVNFATSALSVTEQ